MLNKILKYAVMLLGAWFFYSLFVHFQDFTTLRKKNETSIATEQKALHTEEEKLKKLQVDHTQKLKFVEANKVNFDVIKPQIEATLMNINTSEYFKINLESLKNSKKFLNVAVAELRVESLLNHLELSEFEDLFMQEFKNVGEMLPFVYEDPKQRLKAKIYLILLNKNNNN